MTQAIRPPIAGAVAAVLLAGLVACAPPGAEPEDDLTLTLPVGKLYTNWDPSQGGEGGYEWHAVFDGLAIWHQESGEFEPRLARELTFSEDGTRVSIELRDDVDFVDGEHMTAEGVAGYLTVLIESGQYIMAGLVGEYGLTFEATGEYTVEMTATKRIYLPDFWSFFGYTPILSPAALEDREAAKASPLGTGPYLLDEVVPDAEMTFVRNPDYWDPESWPYDRIVLKVIEDPVASLNALKSGQVDAAGLGVSYAAEAEAAGLTVVESLSFFRTLWVYDPVNSPLLPLRDVRVRQAMMHAFDRETIAETLDLGYGRVSSQAFDPGQAEYVEGGDDRYPYDPQRARELLAEAGYPDGFDVVIPSCSDAAAVEPIVQQSLADIGIRVTYEQFPDRDAWFRAMGSGEYPLILEPFQGPAYTLAGLVADYPGYGRTFAYNAEIEALVQRIEQGDPEESAAASQEMGALLLDEAWYIPFSRPSGIMASIPEVTVHVSRTEILPPTPNLWDYSPTE